MHRGELAPAAGQDESCGLTRKGEVGQQPEEHGQGARLCPALGMAASTAPACLWPPALCSHLGVLGSLSEMSFQAPASM